MVTLMVDTNVISFELRHDTRATLYTQHLRSQALMISFATLAELRFGARRRNWGVQRLHRLDLILRPYLVIYPDDAICQLWADVLIERERIDRPISENDAWIAACALRYGVALVTHNPKDFEGISGLQIISENA